jgi:hypothetical protein
LLFFLPSSLVVERDQAFPYPGSQTFPAFSWLLSAWQSMSTSVPGPGMPRHPKPGAPACWGSFLHPQKLQTPQAKYMWSEHPEGLVRKEGNAVISWADCFPCSCDWGGGNTAPSPSYCMGRGEMVLSSSKSRG